MNYSRGLRAWRERRCVNVSVCLWLVSRDLPPACRPRSTTHSVKQHTTGSDHSIVDTLTSSPSSSSSSSSPAVGYREHKLRSPLVEAQWYQNGSLAESVEVLSAGEAWKAIFWPILGSTRRKLLMQSYILTYSRLKKKETSFFCVSL